MAAAEADASPRGHDISSQLDSFLTCLSVCGLSFGWEVNLVPSRVPERVVRIIGIFRNFRGIVSICLVIIPFGIVVYQILVIGFIDTQRFNESPTPRRYVYK